MLENNTITHHRINSPMIKPLSNTLRVNNLSVVARYVYGPKEKAKAFNSNIAKKSFAHSHRALDVDFFLLFKKWIIAEIHVGYKNMYHIVINIANMMMSHHI
jgi:hypothetical protein